MAGLLFRRFSIIPENGAKVLSGYIIYVALPALVLLHVHELKWDHSLIFAALMPHWIFGLSWIVFRVLGKRTGLKKSTIVCLTLTAGLGNTSFVGLPMIQAFFGAEHLGTGILIDQAGSFLCLSTFGMLYLLVSSEKIESEKKLFIEDGQKVKAAKSNINPKKEIGANSATSGIKVAEVSAGNRAILKRVLTFPPFIALAVALALYPFEYSETLQQVLSSIGSTLTPVAMVAVGFQIRFRSLAGRIFSLSTGLLFRLILTPALVTFMALIVGPYGAGLWSWDATATAAGAGWPPAIQITIFEAAMPPMITAGILCVEYDMDPELAGLMLGLGIPLSFLTLPLVHLFLTSGF